MNIRFSAISDENINVHYIYHNMMDNRKFRVNDCRCFGHIYAHKLVHRKNNLGAMYNEPAVNITLRLHGDSGNFNRKYKYSNNRLYVRFFNN